MKLNRFQKTLVADIERYGYRVEEIRPGSTYRFRVLTLAGNTVLNQASTMMLEGFRNGAAAERCELFRDGNPV